MPTLTAKQFLAARRRAMLRGMADQLGGTNLDLIDEGADDFRDVLGDLVAFPDPNEESDFAPLRNERGQLR